MKIEYYYQPNKITIEKFAVEHDLTMEVHQRGASSLVADKFYARFKRCEIKVGYCLKSSFGDGSSPEHAIANYAKEISGKLLVIDAMSTGRKEIQCPELVL